MAEDQSSITPESLVKTAEDLWSSEEMAHRSPLDEEVIQAVREQFPDPRLATVAEAIKEFPEKAELLRRIFSRSLKDADAEVGVIGLRSEDIVTFLVQMLAGSRNLDSDPDDVFRYKEDEVFFMTANFSHPLFRNPPYNLPPSGNETLAQIARSNLMEYGLDSTFSTIIFVQLKPLIKHAKWNEGVRRLLNLHAIEEGNALEPALISEKFCDITLQQVEGLLNEIQKVEDRKILTFSEVETILTKNKKSFRQEFDFINFILDSLEPQVRRPALVLLFDAVLNRMGVQVAYSETIADGSVLGSDTEDELGQEIKTSEVTMRPPNGRVFFNADTVLSAAPMGEYEDQVLEMLGLVN